MNRPPNHRRPWTRVDDERLRLYWQDVGIDHVARLLGRTRTGIYRRATLLDLASGVPDGAIAIHAAAARIGYSHQTLTRILAWADVRTVKRDGPKHARRRPRRYVDRIELDDAIARWLSTESVNGAARARGLSSRTLTTWLSDAGVIQPRRRGSQHRVPTEVIDRVVAVHRPARRAA